MTDRDWQNFFKPADFDDLEYTEHPHCLAKLANAIIREELEKSERLILSECCSDVMWMPWWDNPRGWKGKTIGRIVNIKIEEK